MENSRNTSIVKGEINIRSQITRVLSKWRMIILFGIIFALLGGAYSYYSQKKAIASWKAPEEEVKTPEGIDAPDYTQARERVLRAINDKTEYLAGSIQMKINPASVARAYVDMYIMTDALKEEARKSAEEPAEGEIVEVEIPEETTAAAGSDETTGSFAMETMTAAMSEANRILDHYWLFASRGIDYDGIAAEFGTEERYIRELINVGAQDREVIRATITVSYLEEEGAAQILDYIIEELKNHYSFAAAEFGEHEVIFRNRSVTTLVDTSALSTAIATRVTEFNTLMKQYNDLKTNEKNLDLKIAESESKPKMSRRKMVKTAAAGFVGGMILFAALYILWLSISTKVLSARDLNTLYGLRKLGVLPKENGKNPRGLDSRILGAEIRYLSNPDPEKSCEITNTNVKSVLGEGKKVALVSDIGNAELEHLKERLSKSAEGIEYSVAGDLSEPAARKLFEACDGVVLAARTMESKYGSLNDIMRELVQSDKSVLGSIVF